MCWELNSGPLEERHALSNALHDFNRSHHCSPSISERVFNRSSRSKGPLQIQGPMFPFGLVSEFVLVSPLLPIALRMSYKHPSEGHDEWRVFTAVQLAGERQWPP